jgi:hypothetical protein
LELPTFFPMPYALLVWKLVLEKFLKGILYFSFIVRWTNTSCLFKHNIYSFFLFDCCKDSASSCRPTAAESPFFPQGLALLELLLPLGFLLLPCLCCVILPQHPSSIVCIFQLPTLVLIIIYAMTRRIHKVICLYIQIPSCGFVSLRMLNWLLFLAGCSTKGSIKWLWFLNLNLQSLGYSLNLFFLISFHSNNERKSFLLKNLTKDCGLCNK